MEWIVALIVFFAYFVRTFTGFGSVILLSPILSSFYSPKEAVVLVVLMETFVNVLFLFGEDLNFRTKEIYVGASVGVVSGILLFNLLSEATLGLIIGFSLAVLSLILLFGCKFKVEREAELFTLSGFFSGFFGVLTGVTGPQVVIALVNQGYDAKFVRSFMISYLLVVYAIILAAFAVLGEVRAYSISRFLVFSPVILAAYFLGRYSVKTIDLKKLEKAILIVVLASSINLIVKYISI